MKKTVISLVIGLIVISAVSFYYFNQQKPKQTKEQAVLEQTLEISRQYLALRYQTDNVLIDAKDFSSHDEWNQEMTRIIGAWNKLEKESSILEKNAEALPVQELSFNWIETAHAYDRNEISNVFDKAPVGKKIATLAKYLGVDAKRAQMILNQDQNQVTADAWNEAGDTLNKLEKSAVVIKDGCKIAGFVGTTVLTGGSAALMTGSTLSKVAVVVSGADLTLEIGSDVASIALGNNNKISTIADGARKITEPVSGLLTIATMPGNLAKGIEKLNAISFTAEQINSGVQDGKIIGIEIPEVSIDPKNRFANIKKYKAPVYVSKVNPDEVDKWLNDNNIKADPETKESIEVALKISESVKVIKEEKQDKTEEKKETSPSNSNLENIPNQIFTVVNVSNSSYMMDACYNPTCWDDLAADPAEDRDLGGIYTMGKVFGNGESFKKGFRPSDLIRNSKSVAMLENGYRITVYFAIAPFEGPKNKTINYGTWQNHSVEISANYGDEPVIEWDGSSLKQVK